jgi:hypothetical protein
MNDRAKELAVFFVFGSLLVLYFCYGFSPTLVSLQCAGDHSSWGLVKQSSSALDLEHLLFLYILNLCSSSMACPMNFFCANYLTVLAVNHIPSFPAILSALCKKKLCGNSFQKKLVQ